MGQGPTWGSRGGDGSLGADSPRNGPDKQPGLLSLPFLVAAENPAQSASVASTSVREAQRRSVLWTLPLRHKAVNLRSENSGHTSFPGGTRYSNKPSGLQGLLSRCPGLTHKAKAGRGRCLTGTKRWRPGWKGARVAPGNTRE